MEIVLAERIFSLLLIALPLSCQLLSIFTTLHSPASYFPYLFLTFHGRNVNLYANHFIYPAQNKK
jgi:hypothetical protein